MKNFSYFIVTILIIVISGFNPLLAQTLQPSQVKTSIYHDVSPAVRDMKSFIKEDPITKAEVHNPKKPRPSKANSDPEYQPIDPAIQEHFLSFRDGSVPEVVLDFEGIGRADIAVKYYPPDTHGDVGPNHYVQAVNAEFKIWDKSGNVLVDHLPLISLFEGFDDGKPFEGQNPIDPVVHYDEYADRWLIAGFTVQDPYFYMLIAVSTSPDPTGTWNRYAYEYYNIVPDYEKFGVWHDGYYMTTNNFGAYDFDGAAMTVFDREAMLNGDAIATAIEFDLGYNYFGFLPADADGVLPPPNNMPHISLAVNYSNVNILDVLTTSIDWDVTANSTAILSTLAVVPYADGGNARQPGSYQLDGLADRLMYRLQYRNFGSYHTLVTNHTVRNTSTNRLGIRWYELRNTGSDFEIYQQGTLLPADNTDRWMGSIAMNGNGDIALGYSITNTVDIYPSIRFTGQTAGAPGGLGVMDLPETNIVSGTVAYTGGGGRYRWGDYSSMTVDPSDDNSFWYTQEYSTNSTMWVTRVAKLNLNAVQVDPAMIAVTPSSFTFTVGLNGTDSDLLNIANTGLEGADDLTWSLGLAEPWLSASPESGTIAAGTSQDVTVSVDAAGLDYGTYNGELTISSNATNASQVIVPVTLLVVDIVPPVITVADPITLWPPNGKYENFDLSELVVSVEDNVDGTIPVGSVVITSASSDEPDNAPGNGDGNTVNDIVIAADCKTIDLRKERQGKGNGRVYEVHVSVADAAGNVGTATCLVTVPHDRTHDAVNDGPSHTFYSNCGEEPPTQQSLVAGIDNSFESKYNVVNYPNPFKGTTTIQFTLEQSNYTKLVVYNSMGVEVATLFEGVAEADQVYKVEFNALDLAGGVYFYRLQSGESINTMKKMMLVK